MEADAIFWLRFKRSCPIVLTERSPLHNGGQPDVLGITQARYCIEVECKRSMSDFRANAQKFCVKKRDDWISRWPKEFYFCVPDSMADRAEAELPDYAGLLTVHPQCRLVVRRKAPVNYESARLTLKQYCHVVKLLTNELHWGRSRNLHQWAWEEMLEQDYQI